MVTLADKIRQNKQFPIIKLYIKRKDNAGVFETDWLQINTWKNKDIVLEWGEFTNEIDYSSSNVLNFEASGTTIKVDNALNQFTNEFNAQSIWFGYLNRRYTKVKIEAGYLDGQTEIGVANIFEGFIDKIQLNDDATATLTINSYTAILSKYNASDLTLNVSGTSTINDLLATILNQSKITSFIPFTAGVTNNVANNYTVYLSAVSGSYFDVIRQLTIISNSTIYLVGSDLRIEARTEGSSVWDFKGIGSSSVNDIYKINNYDDEGAESVRLYFVGKSPDESYSIKSTSTSLLLKYADNAQEIDLTLANNANKSSILTNLLARFQNPKTTIEFTCKFMVNTVKPLDKVTIETYSRRTTILVWGNGPWGIGTWGGVIGGITISSGKEWLVTKVTNDLKSWVTKIRVEEI